MKKFLVSFAFIAMCLSAQAQIVDVFGDSYEVKDVKIVKEVKKGWKEFSLEYNPSRLVPDEGDSFSMSGINIGWGWARSLSSSLPLYLQYGIGIQYFWGKNDVPYAVNEYYTKDVEQSIYMLGIKVPFNVIYHYDIPNTAFAIEPLVGLNIRANALGERDNKGYREDDCFVDLDWNRVQIGYNIGVNAVYDKFVFGVSYTGDFSELGEDLNMSVWNIKVGVRF